MNAGTPPRLHSWGTDHALCRFYDAVFASLTWAISSFSNAMSIHEIQESLAPFNPIYKRSSCFWLIRTFAFSLQHLRATQHHKFDSCLGHLLIPYNGPVALRWLLPHRFCLIPFWLGVVDARLHPRLYERHHSTSWLYQLGRWNVRCAHLFLSRLNDVLMIFSLTSTTLIVSTHTYLHPYAILTKYSSFKN